MVIRSVVGSAIIGVLLFFLLVSFAPDSITYSPDNFGWNGMSQLDSSFQIHYINSLATLPRPSGYGNKTVLLVVQPTLNFSADDAAQIGGFVRDGGILIVAGDSGTSDSLLALLGTSIRIESNVSVVDPMYNWKAETLPTATIISQGSVTRFSFLDGISGIGLTLPSPLSAAGGSVLALSSNFSYTIPRPSAVGSSLLTNQELKPVSGGPFAVAAAQYLGKGIVLVVGDSQFFTNAELKIADNLGLIRNVLSGSRVYLDTSHWPGNTIASLRSFISSEYAQISRPPLLYLATAGFVALTALIMMPTSNVAVTGEKGLDSPLDRTYNREALERVRKDRERYGVR